MDRNVGNIRGYRKHSPAHVVFEEVAKDLGLGLGSLAVLYKPCGPFQFPLLILDQTARNMLPLATARLLADAIGVEKFYIVDLSKVTREAILASLGGTRQFPKYKQGEKIVKLTNGRTGEEKQISIMDLAMMIRQSVDPWLHGSKKWNLATQTDDTDREVAPLTEETYKLLERQEDFLDFIKRCIHSHNFIAIDMDAVLFDRVTGKPLVIAEFKSYTHKEPRCQITVEIAKRAGVPGGLIRDNTRFAYATTASGDETSTPVPEFYTSEFGQEPQEKMPRGCLKKFLKDLIRG